MKFYLFYSLIKLYLLKFERINENMKKLVCTISIFIKDPFDWWAYVCFDNEEKCLEINFEYQYRHIYDYR